MIEQKYIDEVLDKVDLTEVAEDYGITLKLKGHRAWACCPFHNEDTASFCIDTVKNLWYCYGCGKGGNVINFVMEKDGLTFPLAVKKLLKEKLDHDLTDEEMKSTPEEEEKHKRRESMRIINDRLAIFFVEQLQKETDDARMAKAYMLNRWTGEGTSNRIPRYVRGDSVNWQLSDLYVYDGSYGRLKTLQLGYTLPEKLTKKILISSLRLYVSAENLVTLTKYHGYDPEISSGGTSLGIDYGVYPQPRTFRVGLNLKF